MIGLSPSPSLALGREEKGSTEEALCGDEGVGASPTSLLPPPPSE